MRTTFGFGHQNYTTMYGHTRLKHQNEFDKLKDRKGWTTLAGKKQHNNGTRETRQEHKTHNSSE